MLIILGYSSCKKSERFIMRIDGKGCVGYDFMFLSDKDGSIVAQSLLSDHEDFVLSLPGHVDDRYDLTIGNNVGEETFSINTYRDIGTGFEIKERAYHADCLQDYYERGESIEYEVEILGISDLSEVFLSSGDYFKKNSTDESVVIKYHSWNKESIVLTVRVNDSSELLSLILNPRIASTWSHEDGVLKKTVTLDDFKQTIVHTLTINKGRVDYLEVRAVDIYNQVVFSFPKFKVWDRLNNPTLPQVHNFYYPEDFLMEKLLLKDYFNTNLYDGIISIGFHHFYSEFPAQLDFYEPDIKVSFDDDEYDIEFDGYDKLLVKYFYKVAEKDFDGYPYSSWDVHQRSESGHSYCLPSIPKKIKKAFPVLKDFKDLETIKKVGAFRADKLETVQNNKLFSSIECVNYSCKWVEIE